MSNKLKILLFALSCCFSINGNSQDLFLSEQQLDRLHDNKLLDSIISAVDRNQNTKHYFSSLSLATDYYLSSGQYDTAYIYFELALEEGESSNYWSGQIDIVVQFDFLFITSNNFAKGIATHEQLLSSHGNEADDVEKFYLHSRAGYFNESIGRVKEGTENYFQALNYAERLDDDLKMAQMFNNIGNAYISINQFDEAKRYIERGINLCENDQDITIPILYNNLAKINENDGETEQAIANYKKCLKSGEGTDAIITSSINLSEIWILQNELDSASYYSLMALETSHSLGAISPQLVRSQIQASRVCKVQGNLDCQGLYLDSAYVQAKNLSLLIGLEVITSRLSTYYEELKNPSKALFFIRENIAYNDSINLQETQSILFNGKEDRNLDSLKFASFKLESEKQLLKVEVSKQNSVAILASCLFFSLIFVILLYYRNVQRKRKILRLELKQKEDTIISKNKEILSANLEIDAQETALAEIRNKLTHELSSEYDAEFNELNNVFKQTNRSLSKLDRRKYVNDLIKSTDTNFHKTLKEQFPDLTIGELKMLTLIRLNLGTEELTEIFNISRESLNKKRYRIRKKLNLSKSQDLDAFIRDIS